MVKIEEDEAEDAEIGTDEDDVEDDEAPNNQEEEDKFFEFRPPLYIQRYDKVIDDILLDAKWTNSIRKIVDFGCAEGKLIGRIKASSAFVSADGAGCLKRLRELIGVDVDEEVLESASRFTAPLPGDSIFPRQTSPLSILLMKGSVSDEDARLKGADVVTAIELVEHLDPDVLSRFPQIVFGFIKPKLVVISTPNAEFNVVFRDFEGPFRHWDHRFEWSRSEFRRWIDDAVLGEFPEYAVEITGVGTSAKRPEVGFCTQIAVFKRRDFALAADNGELLNEDDEDVYEDVTEDAAEFPYKILQRHVYPFRPDTRSTWQKFADDMLYQVRERAVYSAAWEEGNDVDVALDDVIENVDDIEFDMEDIVKLLEENDYRVRREGAKIIINVQRDQDEDEEEESDQESREEEDESVQYEYESDWD